MTYSQSKVVYKIINRYIECVNNGSFKKLGRFISDYSKIVIIPIKTYLGYNIIKIRNDITVVAFGRNTQSSPVFIIMKIAIEGSKISVLSIQAPKSIRVVDDYEINSLLDSKMENGVYLKRI